MARYTLTVRFDDPLDDDGPLFAQLAASSAVAHMKREHLRVVDAELVDHQAEEPRWQGGVDWLEFCQTEEAQEEPCMSPTDPENCCGGYCR
jgi:hypothetical protein